MKPVSLHLIVILALFAALVVCSSGLHVPGNDVAKLSDKLDNENVILRYKRDVEDLGEAESDVFQTTSSDQPEEPGFWDRIVKVALKLFSRFIEWLNS